MMASIIFLIWLVFAQASVMVLYRWIENELWQNMMYSMPQFEMYSSEKRKTIVLELLEMMGTKRQLCFGFLFVIALPLLLCILLIDTLLSR